MSRLTGKSRRPRQTSPPLILMSSSTGIARNRAWPSTGSSSRGIALTLNPVNPPPERSICVLAPCAADRAADCGLLSSDLAVGIRRVNGVKKLSVDTAFCPFFLSMPGEFLAGFSAAPGNALVTSVANLGGFVGPYTVGLIRQKTCISYTGLICAGIFLLVSVTLTLALRKRIGPSLHLSKQSQKRLMYPLKQEFSLHPCGTTLPPTQSRAQPCSKMPLHPAAVVVACRDRRVFQAGD